MKSAFSAVTFLALFVAVNAIPQKGPVTSNTTVPTTTLSTNTTVPTTTLSTNTTVPTTALTTNVTRPTTTGNAPFCVTVTVIPGGTTTPRPVTSSSGISNTSVILSSRAPTSSLGNVTTLAFRRQAANSSTVATSSLGANTSSTVTTTISATGTPPPCTVTVTQLPTPSGTSGNSTTPGGSAGSSAASFGVSAGGVLVTVFAGVVAALL